MGAPVVLAFNVPDAALVPLSKICEALAIRLKRVPAEGFSLPLGVMAGIPSLAPVAPVAGQTFDDPMLVMCNFDEARFDRFLQGLRYSGVRVPLKAVLTPTNAAWNAFQLHDELRHEHDEMERLRRTKGNL